MKEVNFKDRVPKYPGRITLTPVEGQTNTYEMTRADEPTEAGTPLDKATFNSIIHSRLTGRYYTPSVSYVTGADSRIGVTASPLPTSGWVYETGNNNVATSGGYIATVDSNYSTSYRVAGAFNSDGWRNASAYNPWIQIEHPQSIKINIVRCAIEIGNDSSFVRLDFQGSNDGTTWTTLGTLTSIASESTIAYRLGNPGDYKYLRLYFTFSDSTIVTVRNLSYSNYDILTYTNRFTVTDGVPVQFTEEQRILLKTSADVSTFAVTANTLNGKSINTILLPNKRYELVYNGSSFDAKEV